MQPRTTLAPILAAAALAVAGCATSPGACELADTNRSEAAFAGARTALAGGCETHFFTYLDQLLEVAEEDPGPVQKERFSEFLVWSADQGVISRKQAQTLYNRYFNVKFVSLAGDYNNCSSTCRRPAAVLADMEAELRDKEQGLLKISRDADSYYRANRLLQESELVLEATCRACDVRSASR
ncbi:MAG: hypothetical protein P8080_07800 [Gammaproteobacteria bacterium]